MIGARTFTNKTRTEDIQCVIYARLGFSMELISQRTGLSKGAIGYRMKLFNIKLADYRNGASPVSQRILDVASADSKRLMDQIKVHISRVQLEAGKEES
jgi:hypothetical protein